MTAPSRIPHGEAVRNAVRVEWMRLETWHDLMAATRWLNAHGVGGVAIGAVLLIRAGNDTVTARLGQVLVFVPESGEFSVWDWRRFVEAHPGVEA